MVRRATLLVLVASMAMGPTSAAAKPSRSFPIRLGVGIGPINLGMTGQQVRRALGRPTAVVERHVIRGQQYVRLQWGYGAWDVGLLGRNPHRRVVLIATGLTRHRTRDGVGVGTTESVFFRRMRGKGLRERDCWQQSRSIQWYLRRGSAETVFLPTVTRRVGEKGYIRSVEIQSPQVVGCTY